MRTDPKYLIISFLDGNIRCQDEEREPWLNQEKCWWLTLGLSANSSPTGVMWLLSCYAQLYSQDGNSLFSLWSKNIYTHEPHQLPSWGVLNQIKAEHWLHEEPFTVIKVRPTTALLTSHKNRKSCHLSEVEPAHTSLLQRDSSRLIDAVIGSHG